MQFHFRLNPVLKLRTEKEKEAVLKQARAYQEYLQQMEILQTTRNQLENSLEGDAAEGVFDILNSVIYRDNLKTRIAEQKQRAARASSKLRKCRRDTLEARKQKLQLEKLKQKQLDRFICESGKMEQKINDELAMQLSFRNNIVARRVINN